MISVIIRIQRVPIIVENENFLVGFGVYDIEWE